MPRPPEPEPEPAPEGRASGGSSWKGSARNPWLVLVLVLVLGHGAVMNLLLRSGAAVYLNAAHLLILLLVELFSHISVSVDRSELCIRFGHLGWIRQRIALARVEAARPFQLDPMQHGGFGYRGSLRRSGRAALVVRAGAALELALEGGERLSISVDDAERGARVINRLVASSRSARARDRAAAPG